jgi:hypothetical protein
VVAPLSAAEAVSPDEAPSDTVRRAQAAAELRSEGYVVEAYYRIRWGFETEFYELFRRNHLPFLRRALEKGSLLSIWIEAPREHLPESERWDLRVTLVYRDATAAVNLAEIDEADFLAIVGEGEAEERFEREEQRRFELLVAHWDVNVGMRAFYHAADLPPAVKVGGD